MQNLIKNSILVLLAVLAIIFALLFEKYDSPSFLNFSLYCILFLGISAVLSKVPIIYGYFKNKKSLPVKVKINEAEILWNRLVNNLPIPAIIFDNEFRITDKNTSYLQVESKFLERGIYYINELLDLNKEVFNDVLKKVDSNNNRFEIIEAKLLLKEKKNYIIFISTFGTKKEKFLAILVDNSEKSELKEKFIQAQKMQGIGQLAGGIAHDFNNILTAIIGFCDLLISRHKPEDEDYVDIMQIKQNANRAANLTGQLLAFSRRQTMQIDFVNPNDAVSETTDLLRRLIGENIELKVDLEKSPWNIKTDKSQLEQVIINLAINARDAMKGRTENKLMIRISNQEIFSKRDVKFEYDNFVTSDDIEAGKYVSIYIKDTGHGISKDNLNKIFEPFFTTKKVGEGTGLGLATVAGIVEQSGGIIAVSSKVEHGTEFIILLKKAEGKPKSKKVTEEITKQKDLTGSSTILIVEDEDAVRMFSSRALKNKGYEVIEAFSGDNALEVIEKHGIENIDLIISDVVMPGISGPEMVKEVLSKRQDIKVVFVSGYGEDVFYEQYGDERAFNFLPKPYTLDQIAARVKDVLEN